MVTPLCFHQKLCAQGGEAVNNWNVKLAETPRWDEQTPKSNTALIYVHGEAEVEKAGDNETQVN